MKYDFDTVIDRRHSGSIKWDCQERELPMWVADMDFPIAPEIQKAILQRASHPLYGYTDVNDDWYEAYLSFYQERHHLALKKEWLTFSTGVIPTISSTVRKLTKAGDNVVVLTPVYNIFFNSIVNNQRTILDVPLPFDGNTYSIDFKALEKALSLEKTTLLLLCNPANPVGRIWNKEELEEVGRLCAEYGVKVLSDEIHGEITSPGKKYTPFIAVNEINRDISVTAVSVTKCFNLASLQTSAMIIPNEKIRAQVVRQLNTDECAEPNAFAIPVSIAALNQGREWLDEMNAYVENNRQFAAKFIEENLPLLHLIHQEATYLLWLDISKVSKYSKVFCDDLRQSTGLWITPGSVYGPSGEGFVRINIACPRTTLEDGLKRLKEGVTLFLKRQ